LTAEDVKATFDRIAKPPQGISIPRSVLFKVVSEIVAPDKKTVQFKLSEPRPVNFIMSAIASGWNVIVRKKTLEDNNYNLRKAKDMPGLKTTAFNQSVIQGCWANSKKKPFDDPRVRRALHLAFDRHTLVDVVKDVAPMRVGGFVYPFSEFATPTEELFKRVGY